MQTPIQYSELTDALGRIGCTEDAAGYHGTLCGSLCVKRPEEIDLLHLLDVGGEPLTPDADAQAALRQLREQALSELQDSDMIFMPLLRRCRRACARSRPGAKVFSSVSPVGPSWT